MAAIKFLTIFFYLYTYKFAAADVIYPNTSNSSSSQKFPALFVFGDSFMDTGNNNYIPTSIQANYLPYGQNYTSNSPTGRFSNGELLSDMLASSLRIKESLPPFLNPTLSNNDLITGVNFASAGSGFDDLTSLSKAIPIFQQIENFKLHIIKLKVLVGEEKAMTIVNNSLIVLSAGLNDWVFTYYGDVPTRNLTYDVYGYQDFLLNRVQNVISELHEIGCRSIMVSGLGPTGCFPFQRDSESGSCVDDQSRDSIIYNQKLVDILTQLQSSLPGIQLVYNDLYTPIIDMFNNPDNYGFVNTTDGCCENVLSVCNRNNVGTCKNPDQFMFWDGINPTLAAYNYIFKYIANNVLPQFS